MANVRYEIDHFYVGVRYIYGDQSALPILPDRTIKDFGVIAGYTYKQRLYDLSIGAGISYGWYVNRGKFDSSAYSNEVGDLAQFYEELDSHSISIPVQADAFWTPSDVFGFGITIFDNINSVENNYGFLFSVKINVF